MAYQTSERYKEIIYSGNYTHKLKLWFNDVELENADLYCENLVIKKRIVPEGGAIFSLNNFISQSIELTLHDIEEEIIVSPIKISIGTLVDDDFEYIPIGIFNIEEKPVNDKNKYTITARDNSVKFDFNYNAEPIITENNGSATKLQIFNDICSQAGVLTDITTFEGAEDLIGIYDNTITARSYICDIAEQAGNIPTISRDGKLKFIDISNLETIEIPLEIVESYESGIHYKIGKLVYESGIIKYETDDTTDNILFIDASNQYINEETLENIKENVIGFEIDSFKTGKILGNPSIDGYDLIKIVDGDKEFITLATYDLTYKGNMIQTFDTTLNENKVDTNTTINGESTFKKWAKTQIDSVEGIVEITTGKVEQITQKENNDYQEILDKFTPLNDSLSKINELETNVKYLQTNTYTKTEINQIANGVGVDGQVVSAVITTSGTFNENGMTYEKTNAKAKTTINEVGINVKDSSEKSLLFTGYVDENNTDYKDYINQTIVGTDNIIVKNYLNIGNHSRLQDYENGTGVFYIGGSY